MIEMLIGAILMGLGLLYLGSQYRALLRLVDVISHETIEDRNVRGQYSLGDILQVRDSEVFVTIMGHREYPIMVDDDVVPLSGEDYDLYFSYIKKGNYKKEYRYDENRNIIMILFLYQGT